MMSDAFNALSSPVRRKIISLLKHRDMTAGEIAEHLSITKPTLSGHLNVLKAVDLVTTTKNGTSITYQLNLSVIEEIMGVVAHWLGRNNEEGNDHDE